MDIKSMHYDFKIKLNKIDSQVWRNLQVPQIDWLLREAELIFIKTIAVPRYKNGLGFEVSKRSINDIRTIVVDNEILSLTNFSTAPLTYTTAPPDDYMFEVATYATCSKGGCTDRKIRVFYEQHDDLHLESSFTTSNFEWEEVTGRWNEEGIRVWTDDTFTISNLCLDYIRVPAIMHNAEDFNVTGYDLLNGTTLTGTQDSELPAHCHNDIVNIAVYLATTNMMIPDYSVKMNNIKLND